MDELARREPIIVEIPEPIWYLAWNERDGHYEVCTEGWLAGAPRRRVIAGPFYEPAQAWTYAKEHPHA